MDELLLSKVRLAIVAQLLPTEWVTFTELQKSIDVTNGNLGAHLAKLVEAGYLKEEKRFEGRRPQSRYRLMKPGRTALLRHVAELRALVESGRSPAEP
jgi:DNA-binding transcriptional ArsR family regulator